MESDARARTRCVHRAAFKCPTEAPGNGAHPGIQPRANARQEERLTMAMASSSSIRLGLRENAAQFSLLVLVNCFVGAMVGMERSILPAIAEDEFGLHARAAVLAFIA